MHRSASKVIKHASRLAGKPPSISPTAARIKTATTPVQKNLSLALLTRAASSSATTNPLSYDQIMSSGSVSSDEMSSSIISSTPYSTFSSSLSEADLLPASSSSAELTTQQQQQAVQYCYENSDDEYLTPPTSNNDVLEDYDRYELHHPPCEKVKVSYDTSWGLGLGW